MSTVEVGPLLVGLLSIEDGSCARILGSELSIERLRAVIGQEVEQTTPRAASPLPLSASARTALRSHYPGAGGLVGTGHIARALVGEDAIAALLEAADADVGKVREAARRLDGDGGLP
ncbi:MAG: Clp protease N-terminal domain-containing protein [Egibacteraceae bacterium]